MLELSEVKFREMNIEVALGGSWARLTSACDFFTRDHHHHPSLTLATSSTMAGRGSSSATALRRLMTEYKQLTAGGDSLLLYLTCASASKRFSTRLPRRNVHRRYGLQAMLVYSPLI